ncbi:metallophosphoesterase [Candidatus Woesearchaeota archaeon]|nr:metallophosphoesterase [Candidatus Woesearchaeota archaeon]
MNIAPHIQIIETALWLEQEEILIINDLHLGYEESLRQKGVLIPKFQLQEIVSLLQRILQKVKPDKIIINGDLKHEFGKILNQEWKDVLQLLDFLLQHCAEIIIIRGNHDPIIKPIAEKRRIKVVTEYRAKGTLILHGDELVETDAKRIIIGHEHPAITIREGSKWEKYKCFLKGKWNQKELIAVPSFNPLLEGTDILKEETLSPFLKKIDSFDVFIVNESEVFNFGKVKKIKEKNQ